MKSIPAKFINQVLWSGLLLAVGLMLTGTSTAQNHYYVSPSGSDSNAGTPGSPWKTIGHANSALRLGTPGTCAAASGWLSVPGAGACVHVLSGTTTGSEIDVTQSGGSGSRIVFISETQYGAHLVGTTCQVVRVTGNFVDIDGFDITGSCSTGLGLDGSHVRAIGNRIHDLPGTAGYAGILANCCANANLTDAQVIGNIINNIGPSGASPYVHGIYISTPNSLVENNIISNTAGYCIQFNHATTANIISNNTVFNCRFGGIGEAGNSEVTLDHSSILNNIVVNTGNGTDCGIEERFGATGPNNVYRNNLFSHNSCTMFFQNGPRTTSGNVCDVAGTGCATVISSTQANPANIFVNYTGNAVTGDYHLKAGSIAIGAGVIGLCATGGISPCVPATDILGVNRPRGSILAVGAFEKDSAEAGIPSAPTGLTASVQ